MLAASLVMIMAFFFPIWKISLEAPQYPEGMGMYIWVYNVTGERAGDLQTINGLNHYIGMKTITPDTIAELKIMPYLLGTLILAGLWVAWKGRVSMITVWLILAIILMTTGLVDFYLWEYDYGHNLDPSAPIKVPGMSYQPPLIGTKQLLNMRTTSLPYIGSFAIFFGMALAAFAMIQEKWNARKTQTVKGTHAAALVR